MLITFSNVKLTNLDGYAYKDEAANYSQKGVYKKGNYEINNVQYADIASKKKKTAVAPLYDRIHKNKVSKVPTY